MKLIIPLCNTMLWVSLMRNSLLLCNTNYSVLLLICQCSFHIILNKEKICNNTYLSFWYNTYENILT